MWELPTTFIRRFRARGTPVTVAITLFISGFTVKYTSAGVIWVDDLFIAISFVIILGILLWPDRIPPRKTVFKNAKVIWGLWYTGRDTRLEGLIDEYHDKIKRILLLNPDSAGFKENVKETGGFDRSAKRDIMCLTRMAKSYKISIRWYNTMQPRSLTFYDPEDVDTKRALLVSRVVKRYYDASERPLKKYHKKDNDFSDNLDLFKYIWDNQSFEPNIPEDDANNEQ